MEKIKVVRKEVANLLDADLEISTTLQTHVYESRQLPGRFDRELCVFSFGTQPSATNSLGGAARKGYYQIALIWVVTFEPDQLAAAEDVSDDLEDAIYRIFLTENYKNEPYWRKAEFPGLSIRPLAPGGTQNAHFGRTTLRLQPTV